MAIAIDIRLQLQETPIFQEIKAKGGMTKNPWREAFLSANIKFVLIASIIVIGEGVVWYRPGLGTVLPCNRFPRLTR